MRVMSDVSRPSMPEHPRQRFRFGPYEVDCAAGEVRKFDVRIKLSGQPFDILCLLLARAGQTVTREELKQRLWPADVFVDFERSLNAAVKKLRRVLHDSPEEPRYIETQSRRGYRFIAPVEILEPKAAVGQATVLEFPPELLTAEAPASEDATADEVSSATSSSPDGREPETVAVEESGRGPVIPASFSADTFTGKRLTYAVIAAVIVLAGFLAYRGWERRADRLAASASTKQQVRSSIAVLAFKNLSRDAQDSHLSRAFSQMISTELQQGGPMQVFPPEKVAQAGFDAA
jgi:DNA-binding winged helix-turn-helix (wHTH) protein